MIVLQGRSDRLDCVRFTADGRGVVTASGRVGVQCWPDWSAGGRSARSLGRPGGADRVEPLPDGRVLVWSDGLDPPPLLYDPRTRATSVVRPDPPAGRLFRPAVSPDGSWFAAVQYASGGPARVCRRDLADPNRPVWDAPTDRSVNRVLAVLADGRVLTEERDEEEYGEEWRHVLRSPADGAVVGDRGGLCSGPATPSPDRAWLAWFDGRRGVACRTDAPDDPPLVVTLAGRKYITGLAFHPSGGHLAATSNDATVTVFALPDGRPVRTFDWDIGRLRSVAFSPDGTVAAAGADKGKVVVWDFDA